MSHVDVQMALMKGKKYIDVKEANGVNKHKRLQQF